MPAWTSSRRISLQLAALLLLLGFAYSWLPELNARDSHYKNMLCGDCHLAGTSVTKHNAHQLVATQEQLCARCHENELQVSHPSGFTPMGKIPDEYPLDWKGDITCSTCHLVHSDKPQRLRGKKRGRELCLACHDMAFFNRMKDSGLSIQTDVHQKLALESAAEQLDSYSANCTSCHVDSVRMGGQRGRESSRYILAHGYTSMPHPIGFEYATKAVAGGRYRVASELAPEIRLPDGKISCVTCHQAYDQDHGKLVMSNNQSALCFQCHNM